MMIFRGSVRIFNCKQRIAVEPNSLGQAIESISITMLVDARNFPASAISRVWTFTIK